MERLIVALSITTVLFAIGYATSAAIGSHHDRPTPVAPRPLDAAQLTKKLETLDARLHEAQKSIDEVLVKLPNAREDSERDATRVRLDVLFRLEAGLTADIARTRDELARVSTR